MGLDPSNEVDWVHVLALVLSACADSSFIPPIGTALDASASVDAQSEAGDVDGARHDGGPDGSTRTDGASDAPDAGAVIPGTAEGDEAFENALRHYFQISSTAPADVRAMTSVLELALVGVLRGVHLGRKAYAGPGQYYSYANLEIDEVTVLKGELPLPEQSVYVELPWPNNAPLEELAAPAPVGTSVIVLADHVAGAIEEAEQLEAEGIDAVDTVQPNLVGVPSWGLILEGHDGSSFAPLWPGGPLVESGGEALEDFESARSAISAAITP